MARALALLTVLGFLGCGSSGSDGGQDAAIVVETVILSEFDGNSDPGSWSRMEPRSVDFDFTVDRDSLVMMRDSNANQHIVRDGLTVEVDRPYFIEVDFAIHAPIENPASFALNFLQGGPDGDTSAIDSWALNLDLGGSEVGGVIKYMGFMGGGFRSIGQRSVSWGEADVQYTLRVEVNRTIDGRVSSKAVTATFRQGNQLLERFEQSYDSFPYQPSEAAVRFGLNSHGAHWTARNLRVGYLD